MGQEFSSEPWPMVKRYIDLGAISKMAAEVIEVDASGWNHQTRKCQEAPFSEKLKAAPIFKGNKERLTKEI